MLNPTGLHSGNKWKTFRKTNGILLNPSTTKVEFLKPRLQLIECIPDLSYQISAPLETLWRQAETKWEVCRKTYGILLNPSSTRLTLSNSCTPGDPLEPRRTPSKDSKILPTGDQFIKAAAPTFQASGEAWKVHKKTQDHLTGASLHLETDLNQGKT